MRPDRSGGWVVIRVEMQGDDKDRRARLHELDTILDALEQLNLHDNTSLPKHLRDSLESAGVSVSPRATITELIERVWEAQERYLQPGSPESPGGALRGGR